MDIGNEAIFSFNNANTRLEQLLKEAHAVQQEAAQLQEVPGMASSIIFSAALQTISVPLVKQKPRKGLNPV